MSGKWSTLSPRTRLHLAEVVLFAFCILLDGHEKPGRTVSVWFKHHSKTFREFPLWNPTSLWILSKKRRDHDYHVHTAAMNWRHTYLSYEKNPLVKLRGWFSFCSIRGNVRIEGIYISHEIVIHFDKIQAHYNVVRFSLFIVPWSCWLRLWSSGNWKQVHTFVVQPFYGCKFWSIHTSWFFKRISETVVFLDMMARGKIEWRNAMRLACT